MKSRDVINILMEHPLKKYGIEGKKNYFWENSIWTFLNSESAFSWHGNLNELWFEVAVTSLCIRVLRWLQLTVVRGWSTLALFAGFSSAFKSAQLPRRRLLRFNPFGFRGFIWCIINHGRQASSRKPFPFVLSYHRISGLSPGALAGSSAPKKIICRAQMSVSHRGCHTENRDSFVPNQPRHKSNVPRFLIYLSGVVFHFSGNTI